MNQFRCKQVQCTVVLGFKAPVAGFFTGAVEKWIPAFGSCLPSKHPTQLGLAILHPRGYEGSLPIKSTRLIEEQIVGILKEHGTEGGRVGPRAGVSEARLYG
jgi:hypothetical protein